MSGLNLNNLILCFQDLVQNKCLTLRVLLCVPNFLHNCLLQLVIIVEVLDKLFVHNVLFFQAHRCGPFVGPNELILRQTHYPLYLVDDLT